ncbi:bifunctional Mechanosensitive ion channel MscS domain superfamily/LSM domain superfamily/Mechanosensitive ion channel MscS/Mechanosensitive ion channel MscS-like [Babesia duncani]|uniref:Bifunctional Mechanosensitive ion channel MscS domain superfamily/LSM domain superfamily/Mechanosensitive ion channel MscS/Mechanosensitive ion channel MscS-like n=1 Tax=Babesia duncani TaxID=323732 RepID=A0AAD9UQR2_9APIC|nr:bifunctional Mechanosensitive ion channel MscS domain superfamily/LSM domain superfamily/Mechanosensitive ion channel MscS/Mechanosensitive ion channel MscS-like [Babesia duncani]
MATDRSSSMIFDISDRNQKNSTHANVENKESKEESVRKHNLSEHIYNLPPTIDYDENEDQDEDDGIISIFKSIINECFPDTTPFTIMSLHVFIIFFYMAVGPLIIPSPETNGTEEVKAASKVILKNTFADPDRYQARLLLNSAVFLLLFLCTNFILLLIIMFARFLIMKIIFEPLYRLSKIAVIITYAVDPYFYYCIWSGMNYAIFHKHAILTSDKAMYGCDIYGSHIANAFKIDSRCYESIKFLYIFHILVSIRKLILSTILFLFELGFLRNYSADLKTFLNAQALLRKFNISWLVYLRNTLKTQELNENISRLRDVICNYTYAEPPECLKRKCHNKINMRLSIDFKVFRPTVYRFSHDMINPSIEAKIKEFPEFFRSRTIRNCSNSALTNWSAINFIIQNPPELLLFDYSVELASKETLEVASKLFFDQIFDSLSALTYTPEKSPSIGHPLISSSELFEDILERQGSGSNNSEQAKSFEKDSGRSSTSIPLITRSKDKPSSKMPAFMHYRTFVLDPEIAAEILPTKIKSPSAYDLHNDHMEDNARVLTPKMCSGINPKLIEEFFAQCDLGNCGYISSECFQRHILYICSIRKRLMATLKNQRSILGLVRRLTSVVLWFTFVVIFLLSFKVNKNVVFPSTIGFFSATIMALSYMYTSFITAIIFVVLSNPYNVGDRVRVNGGEAMYVVSINIYNTEFRCIHGKVVTYQNAVLSTMTITNETRAQHATHEFTLRVGVGVTPASLKQLKENIKCYINGRPRHFVKNGCYFYGDELHIGHCYVLKMWVTCIEGWSNTKVIFGLKNDVAHAIARQCKLLGISYKEPLVPVKLTGGVSLIDRLCHFTTMTPRSHGPRDSRSASLIKRHK